jgi:hypothetical protein
MAIKRLERMGYKAECLVARLLGLKPTPKQAIFDLVDFTEGCAYEVKACSALALTGSNKIHIEDGAWARKQAFLSEHGLEGILMVVLITSKTSAELYRVPLTKQHMRISTIIKTGTRIA